MLSTDEIRRMIAETGYIGDHGDEIWIEDKIKNSEFDEILAEVARSTTNDETSMRAVRSMNNPKFLAYVAQEGKSLQVRMEAVNRINETEFLIKVVKSGPYFSKLYDENTNQFIWTSLVKETEDLAVKTFAVTKLKEGRGGTLTSLCVKVKQFSETIKDIESEIQKHIGRFNPSCCFNDFYTQIKSTEEFRNIKRDKYYLSYVKHLLSITQETLNIKREEFGLQI